MIRLTRSNSTKVYLRTISTTSIKSYAQKIGSPPSAPIVKSSSSPPQQPIVPDKAIVDSIKNDQGSTKSVPPPKKKRFSLFGFLFKTTLFTAILYGSTLYIATKNDKVMDFVVDKDLPYHEELIDLIETGSIDDLTDIIDSIRYKFMDVKLPSKEDIEKITKNLEHKGEDLYKETTKKLKSIKHKQGTDLTPSEQLQRPVGVESIKREVTHLPLIELNSTLSKSVDDSVKSTIASFNQFIQSIDANTLVDSNKDLISLINLNINKLATKLNSLSKNFDDELQSKLKVSQTELFSSFTKKELELTENLLHQFNSEKQQLETKLNKRLNQEIKAAKDAISQAATNAVSMVRIEQTKNFEKLINEKINQERNGRLANIDKLNEKILELEKFVESFQSQIISNHNKSTIQQSISNLKNSLLNPNLNDKPKLLKPYLEDLEKLSGNDEILKLAVQDLKVLVVNESTHSILTNSQLLSRWEQLIPELRSASLLPPNAGLLGHLSSFLFSKLLLPVKGIKENGKDIESVIGRVESYLSRGELDLAVEEVTNLKGWCRKLANDWIIESRKRLEIEFLLNIIETESKLI
ncbi:unnamed protein product [Candida verbasci]|uniref:MICOS complex subunit MIC60 n=1 Tax=Candida verbasci TaxID=1227364 RepID=A0A9W4TSF0_9ASCO|nr:unnamed protein product [Candida verbasci]